MAEGKTAQQRLVDAFVHRPPDGMLEDEGLLACLAIILREGHGFKVRLNYFSDLLALSDEQAEIALRHLPELHTPRDPTHALRLVADEGRRRRTRT